MKRRRMSCKRAGKQEAHSKSKRTKRSEAESSAQEECIIAHLSTFEQLPSDDIWKLIELVPEMIQELRLTSRKIKSHVDNYAMQRGTIQLVSNMQLEWQPKRRFTGTLFGLIEVPRFKSKLFEHRLKMRENEGKPRLIARDRKRGSQYHLVAYKFKFQSRTDHEIDLEYLNECMGSQIGVVVFKCGYNVAPPYPLATVANLLLGIRLSRLAVNISVLDDDAVTDLFNPLAPYIDDIWITVPKVVLSDARSLLIGLSSQIQSLAITNDTTLKDKFFGIQNVDWATLIIEMLSEKLDKLEISNQFHREFLSLKDADMLRERIPALGKKIYFKTGIKYPRRLEYFRNEHCIRG